GTGLADGAAAVDAHAKVVLTLDPGHLERRKRKRPVCNAREVVVERLSVDPGSSVTGPEDDAGDGSLPLPRAPVLRELRHQSSTSSGFGDCASCGCSAPA